MRILLISGEYPPVTDGIGTYVAAVAPALAARGHDVHVLSCLPGQERSDADDVGVVVHRRGQLPLPGAGRLRRGAPVLERLRTAASCHVEGRRLHGRFDVVEAPDWMAEGLATALRRSPALVGHLHTPIGLVTRTSRLPVTAAVRASDGLERFATRRAHVLTAPSRLLIRALEDEGWLRPRPWYSHGDVRVVPYPIDPAPWAGLPPVQETAPVVLAVGRLERRKAPEVLLEACARLARAGRALELVFVGRSEEERDGVPYGEWLRAAAERAGVACRLVDHVPHDGLVAWYGRARAVALASRFDNFPMVGLEALASGRPLVCTDTTGTAELLAGSGAGRVVGSGDASALAAALEPYLADAALAARAGRAGRELVERECAPDRIAELREACYREAIARRLRRD